MDGLDAQRLGIKRTVSVKRHESFRFGAKPFPEASAILHDALGLSYSYLSNCNSREVIVDVSPSTILRGQGGQGLVTVFCRDRLDRPAVRCAVDTCKLEHILQNIFH